MSIFGRKKILPEYIKKILYKLSSYNIMRINVHVINFFDHANTHTII